MSDLFKQYTPEEIDILLHEFTFAAGVADSHPRMRQRFYARGSHLFQVWLQLKYRVEEGASYVDTHPDDLKAAHLYHRLIDIHDRLGGALVQHWKEDFRLTVAKILFDAEEIEIDDNEGGSSTGHNRPAAVSSEGPAGDGTEDRQTLPEAEPEGRRVGGPRGRGDTSSASDPTWDELDSTGRVDRSEPSLHRED